MANDTSNMSLLGHIEALRGHLWRAAIAVLIGCVLAFVFTRTLFDEIIFGPYQELFITRRIFCSIAFHWGIPNFCFPTAQIAGFQEVSMSGQFIWHIWSAMVFGLILAFPYIVWEIWRFVKPALRQQEVKTIRGITFYISLLFFLGVSFGYFLLAPITISFLGNYSVSDLI
jgi:sec-independent protein translocase protein TatC